MGYPVYTEDQLKLEAEEQGVHWKDICCVCAKVVKVQTYRGTGVCCENHRKDRDNDHEPFKAVGLKVHEGEDK